jgi:hypothetical protein
LAKAYPPPSTRPLNQTSLGGAPTSIPAKPRFARELTRASGADGRFFDQSFEEFCHRDDLPEFEFIALHGIWSWISDANRRVIVDFIRRKLAVGGVLFMSYNTQPGWAIGAPLRELLKEHGDRLGASTPMAQRIDNALGFAEQLLAIQPLFARLNPTVQEKLDGLKGHPREYLAHEYMNRDWRPMYFSEVATWLEDAKVTFAGSASATEQQDPLNMTPEQMAFLQGIGDLTFRETARDFIINQQFRRDLWIRGPRRLTSLEHVEAHGQIRHVLVSAKADISPKVAAKQGEVTMNAAIYDPIIAVMADHQPRTAAEIEQAVSHSGINMAQLISALGVLTGVGALAPIQADETIKAARSFTDKLNHALQLKARSSNDVGFLASPVTGGGVPVNRFDQLFLLARRDGAKDRRGVGAVRCRATCGPGPAGHQRGQGSHHAGRKSRGTATRGDQLQ